jgi:hypothetical protein
MEPRAEERLHRAPRTDTRVPYSHTFISSAADMPFAALCRPMLSTKVLRAETRKPKVPPPSPVIIILNCQHEHCTLVDLCPSTPRAGPGGGCKAAVRRLLATCSRAARNGSRFYAVRGCPSSLLAHARETGSASRGCTRLPSRVHI